jgi:hypothetical protein
MKEVTLDNSGFLVDSDGVKYRRDTPVVTIQCNMEKRNAKVMPEYFNQKLLDLQKEGRLEKGMLAGNAFLVARREAADKKQTIKRSWGPTEYPIKEICTVEIYELGEH